MGRINPLIATLSMSFIVSGLASKVTSGNLIVAYVPAELRRRSPRPTSSAVRTSIWIAAGSAAGPRRSCSPAPTVGRYIYAAGGNPEAARLAGVRVTGVRILAFAASGAAAGARRRHRHLARSERRSRPPGTPWRSPCSPASSSAARSILGGEGAIWRTVLGVLFIALVGNGFDLLGLDPLYQQITLGVILLAAVGLDAWSRAVRR